jgi:hypothetical protein
LKRLETFEVVEKVSHGVWRLSNTDFVSLSEQWGADIDFKNQQTRHDLDRKSYGAYRLSRSPSQLDDSRQHLTAIDSRTAFDWDTGEILNLDEQWNKD